MSTGCPPKWSIALDNANLHHPACEPFTPHTPLLSSATSINFLSIADCEWRPNFTKGQRNKVALLTVATPDRAVLIRLCRMHLSGCMLPDVLMDFFEDGSNHFLGNGWSSDSSALEYSFDTPREVRPLKLSGRFSCAFLQISMRCNRTPACKHAAHARQEDGSLQRSE